MVTQCLKLAEYVFFKKITLFQITIEVIKVLTDVFFIPCTLCSNFFLSYSLFSTLLPFSPFSLPFHNSDSIKIEP